MHGHSNHRGTRDRDAHARITPHVDRPFRFTTYHSSCNTVFTTTTVTNNVSPRKRDILWRRFAEKRYDQWKNDLVPFGSRAQTTIYLYETFKWKRVPRDTPPLKSDVQPARRDGCTKTDPWIVARSNESHGSSEDPENPHHTCSSPPSAFRFPAHFQPPRTVSFFSWPLNPLFLVDQRTISLLSTPPEATRRRRRAAINANREPIRSYFPLLPSCFTPMLTASFQSRPRLSEPAFILAMGIVGSPSNDQERFQGKLHTIQELNLMITRV